MLTDQDWEDILNKDKQEAAMLRQLAPKDNGLEFDEQLEHFCNNGGETYFDLIENASKDKLQAILKEIQALSARMEAKLNEEKPLNKDGWMK